MPTESEGYKNIVSQVQRLARNAAALAVGGIVAQLAFTLLEVLVARSLGAEIYGVFVTAYAWTVLGTYLMELGIPLWTIQEGSRNHDRIPALLGNGLTVNVVMFAILYLLLTTASAIFASNSVLAFLLIIFPYGLVLTVQGALGAVYSSYQTMQVNAFFQGVTPVAILVVYFIYATGDLALADVGFAYVIGGAILTIAWLVYTFRQVRPKVSAQGILGTLYSSYQYGLSGILGQIYFKADVVMLSALAGLREAGIYAAAFKLVELVFKVAVLSGRVFAPAMFKSSHESDRAFQIFASMMIRFLTVAGLLAGICSFILADELILLMFGDTYAESVPVLRVLGGVMAAKCMMIALQAVLSSIDLHFQRVAYLAVALVAHIAANAVLIPWFGALGAAWATLISGALLILMYAYSASRHRRFGFLRWLLVPSCLATAIAISTVVIDGDIIIKTAAAISLFLAGLYLIGFVHRDEVKFVFRSLLTNGRQ